MFPFPVSSTARWHNKVPAVTLVFWLIKMMSTTVGETAADYLNADLGFGLPLTSLVVGLACALALAGQFAADRYRPAQYWLVVVLISVFGTLVTDNLSDNAGVPLWLSTAGFGAALLATFVLWHRREATLSITAIDSPRREAWYWTAILFTFALGTAAGDWVAEGLQLGYGYAALLFGALIGAIALLRYGAKANAVACFWAAYVLTRPFGAAAGDLLAQPAANGGLGLGTVGTSALFLAIIVGLVGWLVAAQKNSRAA